MPRPESEDLGGKGGVAGSGSHHDRHDRHDRHADARHQRAAGLSARTGKSLRGLRPPRATRMDSQFEARVLRRAFAWRSVPFQIGVALALLVFVGAAAAPFSFGHTVPLCVTAGAFAVVAQTLIFGLVFDDSLAQMGLYYWCRNLCLPTFAARLRARALHLPPPRHKVVQQNLDTATTSSGNVLRATLLTPAGEPGPFPTVLVRTPYGRRLDFGQELLVERGFAVLVQDTRGRFGSGGTFVPVQTEIEDGAATIAWIKQQPWYNGKLAVFGVSYLGFTAWACAGGEEGAEVDLIVPVVSQSRVRCACFLPGGGISLELVVLWLYLVLRLLSRLRAPYDFAKNCVTGFLEGLPHKAFRTLPMADLDVMLTGHRVPFFQDALEHPSPDGVFWRNSNVLCDFQRPIAPVHIVSGWYDFFLAGSLADFQRARAAGQQDVYMTVGDFAHWDLLGPEAQGIMHSTLLGSLNEHLRTEEHKDCDSSRHTLRTSRIPVGNRCHPVCVEIINAGEWLQMDDWPPPATATTMFPTVANRLQWQAPTGAAEGSLPYLYRSAAPMPSAGGPSFNMWNAGRHNQFWIERRAGRGRDLLIFTSEAMTDAIEVVGNVSFMAYVSSDSTTSFDVVARLCCVSPWGISRNICEGVARVDVRKLAKEQGHEAVDASTIFRVDVDMGATACKFPPGYRVRLHVTSAAHPRWMKNVGSADLTEIRNKILPPEGIEMRMKLHLSGAKASSLHLPQLREPL